MVRSKRHCWLTLAALLVVGSARAVPAGGLDVERRVERGLVVAEIRAPELMDSALRERIKSGLTNRLVIDVKLVPEGFGAPIFEVTRTIEIVYDLWDERYLVELRGGGPARTVHTASIDEVAALLGQPLRVELGSAAACEAKRRYRVDATLTVNPVSPQVLQRSREMLTPTPGERGGSSSRSLFGSVARIFFNVSADPGVRELRGLSPYAPVRPEGEG